VEDLFPRTPSVCRTVRHSWVLLTQSRTNKLISLTRGLTSATLRHRQPVSVPYQVIDGDCATAAALNANDVVPEGEAGERPALSRNCNAE
jgi:hypothetical protein